MKNNIVYKYIGKVLIGFAILFIFPIIVSVIYHEDFIPFVIPQIISLFLGLGLNSIELKEEEKIFAREGFSIVTISWILISLIGALPLWLNHDASFVDSLFEIVSGFTTTGATIFKDVEILNKSILFWRSFSHFIGGMGVLAFVMTVIPLSKNDKSMHVLKAEMPGPTVAKLVPSMKKSLIYLYGIYIGLSFTEFILLLIGRLPVFDSLLITFGTAGTGGFSVLNSSIASYSLFAKYVVALFMFLFGVNFNIYFLMLIGDLKTALKSEELKVYGALFIGAVTIVVLNTISIFGNLFTTFTEAIFHVSSIMTSTGYSIGDINIYPTTSRVVMMSLMLVSACAGSTCGGFKISRLILCYKSIRREIRRLVHPNSVQVITFEGKKVSEETLKNTNIFLLLYALLIILIAFIVSFDGFDFETTTNAVFTTFANVGLCFNISNFADFSIISKLVLSLGMLFGRLEVFPLISLITDLKKK